MAVTASGLKSTSSLSSYKAPLSCTLAVFRCAYHASLQLQFSSHTDRLCHIPCDAVCCVMPHPQHLIACCVQAVPYWIDDASLKPYMLVCADPTSENNAEAGAKARTRAATAVTLAHEPDAPHPLHQQNSQALDLFTTDDNPAPPRVLPLQSSSIQLLVQQDTCSNTWKCWNCIWDSYLCTDSRILRL